MPIAASPKSFATSAKDRAENVMIVDLLRNDLSRVCRPESVCVSQLCDVESYAHVLHLVSTRARLAARPIAGRWTWCGLRFPADRSPGRRRCGRWRSLPNWSPPPAAPIAAALGYLGFDGAMDLSILIRTITAGRGWWQVAVGGGIVAASTPEAGIPGDAG